MIKARFLLAGLLFLTVTQVDAAVFYPETFTLANGLQVIVVPNHLSPAVAQMVWYKVGASDEAAGHSGLAHYLEHLMFRGTKDIPAGEFSPRIAAQGGSDNAFTSYDYTAYHEIVAADRLGMIMQMEADRMQNLNITETTATPELSVVLNERQERTDNNPQGKFAEHIRKDLFPNQPYGIPVIGWRNEMEAMTATGARDFYTHHYAPNNAVVVISGDVEVPEVKRLAASTYGLLQSRDLTPRQKLPSSSVPTETHFVMTDAEVQQSQLESDRVVPSYATQKGNQAFANEVLAEALGGGEVGVLYHALVVKQQIASAIEVDYDPLARGPAVFTIAAIPQPERKIEDMEKALQDEMKALASKGIDKASITAAKKRLKDSAIFARDSLLAPGYAFGMALTTGRTAKEVEAWPDNIAAVKDVDVNKALRDLVANPLHVTGILMPDPNATPEERAKARDRAHSNTTVIR